MKRTFISILLSTLFVGCANNYPTNKIPDKHTVVAHESSVKGLDTHRNDPRYKNFDYNRLGYSSSNGIYYGYFDDMGYYCDDLYYPYNDRYTYYDRVHHRGYFNPDYARIPRPKFRVYHPVD